MLYACVFTNCLFPFNYFLAFHDFLIETVKIFAGVKR